MNGNKGVLLKNPPASEGMNGHKGDRGKRNANKGGRPKDSAALTTAIKVFAGVVLLFGLALAGLFAVGYMQQQQQAARDKAEQALQEQQASEDLQQQLEDLQAKQDAQEKADLQKQIDELKAAQQDQQEQQAQQPVVIENNESQQPQAQQPAPSGGTEVVVVAPEDAPEGVIAVAPSFNATALNAQQQSVLAAAQAYYAAVEVGDYNATYNMLSSADQGNYTLDEWVYANQQLDSAAAEFVVTGVELAQTDWYYVYVDVYLPDGSVVYRTTEFELENGYWVHWLTNEEMDMFDEALGY